MSASEIARALGGKPNGSGWMAHCPIHVDDTPSLSIRDGDDGTVLLHCHADCSQDALVRWARDNKHDLSGRRPANSIVAEYDYCDSSGAVRYQAVRLWPKGFRQRQPDGKDGWQWNMAGVKPLPYRLPQLLAAPDKPVFVVEGEKDADRLAREGLVATTNHGGAGKWRSELCRWFKERTVVILPDNDEAGRKHAAEVARKLRDFARRIRILELSGLPPKGDVSDWLDAGHTVRDLRRLAHETPVWEPSETDSDSGPRGGESEPQEATDDGIPTIRLVAGERLRIVGEAIEALDAAGATLYRRGLKIVHVATIPAKASDGGKIVTPAIVAVPGPQLTHELGKAAHWEKYIASRQEWVPIDVPPDIAAKIAALPNEWRFKSLAGIIATPTMRPDGSLLVEPGYDEATSWLLFDPPPMPAIPDEPARDRALAALYLLDRLLDEFPFAFDPEGQHDQRNNPSRSVALSALMTPVLRPALPPAVPLHVFRAPAGGTGKSYLADLASAIATGERCPVISRSPSFEETEKRLVGAALTGQPIISVDNCNGDLQSEFLCQMVERPLLQARTLGVSDLARIANAVTVFANGNNIQIAEDLVRRTIQCSLDANMERPERRTFRRNPLARVLTNRWRYVAAVLTIARAYAAAGMPDRPPPFMSFDRWSDLVRGSLIWLGCADPCDTVAELSIADPVREIRVEVFQAIAKAMPDRAGTGHPVAEIVRMAAENPTLGAAARLVAEDDDGRISPKRLGKWLAASANKIAGGYKLLRNDSDKSRVRWQLARLRES